MQLAAALTAALLAAAMPAAASARAMPAAAPATPTPTNWQRVGNGSVIDVGAGWRMPDAAWDSHEIGTMSVVHANGTYHMFYEACAYHGGHPLRALRIGHATSKDGITWVKDAQPCLRNGTAGEWDDEAVWDPFVLYDESSGLFQMWYGGQAAGFIDIQWGFATSTDGVHWEKFGQISQFDHSSVQQRMNDAKAVYDEKSQQRWHLYFTYWPTGWGQPDQHLVRVTGTNQTNFDFEHPQRISIDGMGGGAPQNASGHMSFSQVVLEGEQWHMFAASKTCATVRQSTRSTPSLRTKGRAGAV